MGGEMQALVPVQPDSDGQAQKTVGYCTLLHIYSNNGWRNVDAQSLMYLSASDSESKLDGLRSDGQAQADASLVLHEVTTFNSHTTKYCPERRGKIYNDSR